MTLRGWARSDRVLGLTAFALAWSCNSAPRETELTHPAVGSVATSAATAALRGYDGAEQSASAGPLVPARQAARTPAALPSAQTTARAPAPAIAPTAAAGKLPSALQLELRFLKAAQECLGNIRCSKASQAVLKQTKTTEIWIAGDRRTDTTIWETVLRAGLGIMGRGHIAEHKRALKLAAECLTKASPELPRTCSSGESTRVLVARGRCQSEGTAISAPAGSSGELPLAVDVSSAENFMGTEICLDQDPSGELAASFVVWD